MQLVPEAVCRLWETEPWQQIAGKVSDACGLWSSIENLLLLLLQLLQSRYLRAVGRKVLWSSACVCLCVCAHSFVRKISQERVHGSPPNLVGGSRG